MRWTDEAIIVSVKKHGETSAVARVFSPAHGIFSGVAKGAQSKANRGVYQPGNVVSATWNARLSEHIGLWKAELLEPTAALVMNDPQKLAALSCACALMVAALPERHPYPKLYAVFRDFLNLLAHGEDWQELYVKLELALLSESGFGLDLTQCAATGRTDDLIYVSPKSGRAVSREAGKPYREKLLPLPKFLLTPTLGATRLDLPPHGGGKEALAGLRLTGYFLDLWLLGPHGKSLPAARKRLVETMKETHGETAYS